ncbi:hypothetical protein HZB02_04885 [Candidatus Woesearchaeota archaeon]|nr:hypothetical protein [Candidatus Woesearchaeota archaeon]
MIRTLYPDTVVKEPIALRVFDKAYGPSGQEISGPLGGYNNDTHELSVHITHLSPEHFPKLLRALNHEYGHKFTGKPDYDRGFTEHFELQVIDFVLVPLANRLAEERNPKSPAYVDALHQVEEATRLAAVVKDFGGTLSVTATYTSKPQ